ncbi:MAG: hypothetical protein ABSD76_17375 [Terriglobales bacterium]|jgi:hypothetical protein
MKALVHFGGSRDSHFRAHPYHTLFSLVASVILAVLAMLILAVTAK